VPEIITYASAGGVVVDGGRVLLVRKKRKAEVRLPKGHIEPGEARREAAVRETIEETGYVDLQPLLDLGILTNPYLCEGRRVIRLESYYLMALTGHTQMPRSEEDEAKFEPFWAPLEEAEAMLTFASEQEFLRRARAALNGKG
jgi:8-oxo-dGTP pyrophosphatase MutT (NUDIX family)